MPEPSLQGGGDGGTVSGPDSFKSNAEFQIISTAKCVLTGIKLMHMIRKGQITLESCIKLSFADQFYALAGQIRPIQDRASAPT